MKYQERSGWGEDSFCETIKIAAKDNPIVVLVECLALWLDVVNKRIELLAEQSDLYPIKEFGNEEKYIKISKEDIANHPLLKTELAARINFMHGRLSEEELMK
jgi:hypothetical protein